MVRKKNKSKHTGLIGEAGAHFVVSELCRRGWVALSTVRNTRGVDVLVMKSDSFKFRALQVKSSYNVAKFWPVGTGWKPSVNLVFIFVRPVDKGLYSTFEAFVVPSKSVFKDKTKPRGNWPGSWHLPGNKPGDKPEMKALQKKLRNNWESIWASR